MPSTVLGNRKAGKELFRKEFVFLTANVSEMGWEIAESLKRFAGGPEFSPQHVHKAGSGGAHL